MHEASVFVFGNIKTQFVMRIIIRRQVSHDNTSTTTTTTTTTRLEQHDDIILCFIRPNSVYHTIQRNAAMLNPTTTTHDHRGYGLFSLLRHSQNLRFVPYLHYYGYYSIERML